MTKTKKTAVLAAILAVGALSACSGKADTQSVAETAGSKLPSSVTYEVEGDWDFASYDDKLESGIVWPKGKNTVTAEIDDRAFMTARGGERTSKVTCRIKDGSKILVEKTVEGSANTAMCGVDQDGVVDYGK